MIEPIEETEFDRLSEASAEEQYDWFVDHVVASDHVWTLVDRDDNWAAFGSEDDGVLLCAWPHERFAAACAYGDWEHHRAVPVDLDVFVEEVLPDLIREGTVVAVFPTRDSAVPMEPERVLRDLAVEMGRRRA